MSANPLPISMRVRLAELGRRLRRQLLVRGICRMMTILLVTAALIILADAVFQLGRATRWILLSGWIILGVFEVWRFMCGALSWRLDAPGLAAAVEKEYPRLGERLTTAVELAGTNDPANGSPYLVDMIVRDAEMRTSRLDLKRAVPATPTIVVGIVSLTMSIAVLAPLAMVPQAAHHARRFLTPWYVPVVESPFVIKVTSGDPTVKRGESTTLSALIEPLKSGATLPNAVAVNIKSTSGVERTPMIFDPVKREAYLTRGPLDGDFEYQIIAGDVASSWNRVTVVDPARLEAARISVLPPAYARRPGEDPLRLEGLSDLAALQHSQIRLDLRFNRAPAHAWLEWKPDNPEAAQRMPGSRINVPTGGSTAAVVLVPALVDGEYRLCAEVDRLRTNFREMPLRVAIDMPPRFEKVAGLTSQPLSIRPGAEAAVTFIVVDDYGVSGVDLEVRVNQQSVKTFAIALHVVGPARFAGRHVLQLSALGAKEGDRVEYRLVARDNRDVPEAGLRPQQTYFPHEGRWAELRVDATAAPLKEQEIAAQKREFAERLKIIHEALKSQQRDVYVIKADNAKRDTLPFEAGDKLDELRGQVGDTADALIELARDLSLEVELDLLSLAARDIAERDVRPSVVALRSAQRETKAEPRTRHLDAAEKTLEEAARKVWRLLQSNETLAKRRSEKQKIEDIADTQKKLEQDAATADPNTLDELQRQQQDLEKRLRQLQNESEPLRQALQNLRQQQFDQAADRASSLERDVRDLTESMKQTEQQSREGRLATLMRQQQELYEKAQELARRTDGAARTAPLTPLRASEIEKAAAAIQKGHLADAIEQQERAAFELDRLAKELEQAVARSRDPREAARQLERLQEELRQNLAESVRSTPFDQLAPERREGFIKQQQAIQRSAKRLSIPRDAKDANAHRDTAAANGQQAQEMLGKNDAATADDRMRQAREALSRLATELPSQEKRLALARPEVAKVRQEQEALAGLIEQETRLLDKNDPDAPATQRELAAKLMMLMKRQEQAAERLTGIDLPGHEERLAKTAAALRQARADLDNGLSQDISASQQAARRELQRLEQAINGQTPADEQADRLAKRQKDLAEQWRRHARQPDLARGRELQRLQAEISDELQKLQAPEAPSTKDDALTLTRQSENAKTPEDAAQQAESATHALQRLADQVNARDTEADRADRLAKKQKDTADRLAKKEENSTEVRKQTQQMIDEVSQLRPGKNAQKSKLQALDALNRAQQAKLPDQQAKARQDAAEALQRLADQLQAKLAARPMPPNKNPEEPLDGIPSAAQANEARRLAEQQRGLRDELARTNERMGKEPPPSGQNPLADLLKEEEAIAQTLNRMAKNRPEHAETPRQAAEAAERASSQMRTGQIDAAKDAGQQAAQALEKLSRDSANKEMKDESASLWQRQREVNKKLENLMGNNQASKRQQADRQRQLQDQARNLEQQIQRLRQQPNTAESGKAEEAAMHAREAEKNLKAAQDQNAKNDPAATRRSQEKAADDLNQAAKDLREAIGKMPKDNDPGAAAGKAVEEAREQMDRAQNELARARPQDARPAMQLAVDKLRQAARQVGTMSNPSGKEPKGNDGSAASDSEFRLLGPLGEKYKGKSWGELPGEIKNEIISDLKARYGEEYARYIKLYFEQLAERP